MCNSLENDHTGSIHERIENLQVSLCLNGALWLRMASQSARVPRTVIRWRPYLQLLRGGERSSRVEKTPEMSSQNPLPLLTCPLLESALRRFGNCDITVLGCYRAEPRQF